MSSLHEISVKYKGNIQDWEIMGMKKLGKRMGQKVFDFFHKSDSVGFIF